MTFVQFIEEFVHKENTSKIVPSVPVYVANALSYSLRAIIWATVLLRTAFCIKLSGVICVRTKPRASAKPLTAVCNNLQNFPRLLKVDARTFLSVSSI